MHKSINLRDPFHLYLIVVVLAAGILAIGLWNGMQSTPTGSWCKAPATYIQGGLCRVVDTEYHVVCYGRSIDSLSCVQTQER